MLLEDEHLGLSRREKSPQNKGPCLWIWGPEHALKWAVWGHWEVRAQQPAVTGSKWVMMHFSVLGGLRTTIYFECAPDRCHPSRPWQRLWWDHPLPGSAPWLLCFPSLTCLELGCLCVSNLFTVWKNGNNLNAHQWALGSIHPCASIQRMDLHCCYKEWEICLCD